MRNLLHEVLHEVFEKVFNYVYNQSSDEKQNAPLLIKTLYFPITFFENFNEVSMKFQ